MTTYDTAPHPPRRQRAPSRSLTASTRASPCRSTGGSWSCGLASPTPRSSRPRPPSASPPPRSTSGGDATRSSPRPWTTRAPPPGKPAACDPGGVGSLVLMPLHDPPPCGCRPPLEGSRVSPLTGPLEGPRSTASSRSSTRSSGRSPSTAPPDPCEVTWRGTGSGCRVTSLGRPGRSPPPACALEHV
jgi:hypothetical protein